MTILVTGGAGYIGAHTCLALLEAGYDLVVLDNFSNSKPAALRRVEQLAGRAVTVATGDVRDRSALRRLFSAHRIDAVIHFAGLKAVGESVQKPLDYYHTNVAGSVALLEVMAEFGVKTFVFSSSATVYGDPTEVPVTEACPLNPTSPYARSKLMVEQIGADLAAADPEWRIALLRYFNPAGAHASGLIGEDPRGIPNNLMPFVAQVAVGRLAELQVFGGDYPTADGTGVRDYIHVLDLAAGHLAALRVLATRPGVLALNLGTGRGCSVLDMVRAFAAASGRQIPYRTVAGRAGDVPIYYADPSLAHEMLGWRATRSIEDMCRDTWRWQAQNPHGYD